MSASDDCWYGYCEDCRDPDCTCDCHDVDDIYDEPEDRYWPSVPVTTVRTVLDEPTVAEVVAEKRGDDR